MHFHRHSSGRHGHAGMRGRGGCDPSAAMREAMRGGHRHGFGDGEGPFGGFGGGFGGGGFGGGRGGGFGGQGGGGRRRMFDRDTLKLILLRLLTEEARHGYDLIREIESRSGGVYAPSPGVIYPMLTMLADMDLIAEQPGEGSRKLFAITPAGEAHVAENAKAAEEAIERLAMLAKLSERNDAAPIRRAMQGLMTSIRDRLSKEGADQDTMLDVAALIDEATAKIERLK